MMEKDDVLEGSFELHLSSMPIYEWAVSSSSIDKRATTKEWQWISWTLLIFLNFGLYNT